MYRRSHFPVLRDVVARVSNLSTHRALRSLLLGLLLAVPLMSQAGAIPGLTGAAAQSSNHSDAKAAEPVDYQALADLLEDPKARQALVDQLRKMAENGARSGTGAASAATGKSPANDMAIAQHLAGATAAFFADARHSAEAVAKTFRRLYAQDDSRINWSAMASTGWRLGALFLLVYVLIVGVDLALRNTWRRLAHWADKGSQRRHLLRIMGALLLAGVTGVAVIGVVYLVGNGLAMWLAQEQSRTGAVLAMFLNAFIVIELSRLALRLVLVPNVSGLRLFPVSQSMARYWARWATVLLWTVGYTTLFLVPLTREAIGVDAARALQWTVSTFALVYTFAMILRRRHAMARAMQERAERFESGLASWLMDILSRSWHVWAMAYFLMVYVVSVTRPGDALPFVARATGLSVLVIGAGILASVVLGQLAGNRIRLSDHHRRRVPLLEQRLNTYLPLFLRLVRVVIGIVVAAGILAIWHVVDAFAWLTTDRGQLFLGTAIDILLIVLLAVAVWLVVASLIEAKLNAERDHLPSARVQTLLTLFRNAVAIALVTMTVMIVLSELGVNIGPLLAGAGVLGLAIGFGAQKLVQDVITGIFIQLENAINTGDIIHVGGIQGTVERLSIRSVGVRDLEGTFHIVPFSSVDVVSNFMRDFAYHKGEYGIAYRENIDEAIEQLKAAFEELYNDPDWQPKILEPVLIPGVTALADSSVNIRVMIKTTPGDQWAVGRAYNRLVKMYFDAAGIEIPFPHTTIYFGIDKDGTSPPANLRLYRGGALPEHAPEPSAKGVPIPDPSNRPEERVPSQADVDGGPDH